MKKKSKKNLDQLKQLNLKKQQQAKIKGGNSTNIIIEDIIDI